MRTAPPVTVAAAASPVWQFVVWTLAVVSVAMLTAWLTAGATDLPTRRAAGFAGWLGALMLAVWAAFAHKRQLPGELRWDGQVWSWHDGASAEAVPCRVRVAADFGRWMLLRCALPRGRAWLALQRRAGHAAQWHALRCALYAPPVHG